MKLIENLDGSPIPDENNSGSMPTGIKIEPEEYLALHSNELISSLLVTPKTPSHPWLIVGTNGGELLFYQADVNHTEETHSVTRQRVHPDSPIEAIACGNLTGGHSREIVTVCADGTLSTFTPPMKEGDGASMNHQQLIQANVRAAYVMDVDGDGNQELVIILTDRVGELCPFSFEILSVRTYRFSPAENRLLPINKWEVPCQITAFGVGVFNSVAQSAELVLSQMGASYYISLPLSGGDKVDLIHQMDNKSTSVMMLPERTVIAGIMGSMMDNLAIRGRVVAPIVKERPLENVGFPLIGSCACNTPDGLELLATVDIRGMVLIYVVPADKTPPESKEPNKPLQHPELQSVAYFETDESCEYMVMTAIDEETVIMSVANIFRHLFLYKIAISDIHQALELRKLPV